MITTSPNAEQRNDATGEFAKDSQTVFSLLDHIIDGLEKFTRPVLPLISSSLMRLQRLETSASTSSLFPRSISTTAEMSQIKSPRETVKPKYITSRSGYPTL